MTRFLRSRATYVGLTAVAALSLAACGGASGSSSTTAAAASTTLPTTSASAAPGAATGRGGQDSAERAKVAACLKAAGITVPTQAGRPSGAAGNGAGMPPSGAPGGGGTPPSGAPSGGFGGGSGGGAFASSAAQAALKACGITLSRPSATGATASSAAST